MSKGVGKKIFFAFCAVIALLVFAIVKYIESPQFARLVQGEIAERIETELGISIEFKNLTISAFPPGFAINEPKLVNIKKGNKIGLEEDTVFLAKRVGISLRMFQTFSRELVVNRFFLEGAKIQYQITSNSEAAGEPITKEAIGFLSRPITFQLESGVNLNIRQVELRDSTVVLRVKRKGKVDVLFIENIKFFALRPEDNHYSSIVDLNNIAVRKDDKVYDLEVFKANFQVGTKKINILSLDIKKDDAIVHAGGTLDGDIRFPQKLESNLRVIARAKVDTVKKYVPGIESMKGVLSTETNIRGRVKDYIIEGKFEASEFGYNLWSDLNIKSNFNYTKNSLKLNKTILSKNSGAIQLDSIQIDPDLWGKDIKLSPKFSNVNFQDFCGDLKEDISNLEVVMNGSMDVTISINERKQKPVIRGLDFKSRLDLTKVTLTNQTWGKDRPRKEIFTIPSVKLYGHFKWEPFKFRVIDGMLGLSTGDLNLSGFVDNETGWNITGVGENIDVGIDIGKISTAPIAGIGGLGVTVKGPASNVFFHFDLDLKNAKYLNLNMGAVTGRVTIDDDKSKLIFKELQGSKSEGLYITNGEVDLSDDEKLNFDVVFKEADIDGVLDLFRYQLREVSWAPYGIRGVLSGRFKVRGTYADVENTMDVRGRVSASRILYQGEIVNSLKGLIGLRRGLYFAKDVTATKYSSKITGEVEYSRSEGIIYEFDWLRGSLRDIVLVSQTGVPINAKLIASGWGRGDIDNFTSKLEITIENGHIGTMPLPGVLIRLDSDELFWDAILLVGDSGNGLRVQQSRRENAASSLEMSFESEDFGFLVCMVNPEYCNAETAKLLVGGGLASTWKGSQWRRMTGDFSLRQAELRSKDYSVKVADAVVGKIKNGESRGIAINVVGDETDIKGSYGFSRADRMLEYSFNGNGGINGLRLLTPLITRSSGNASVDVSGKFTATNVALRGDVKISDASLVLRGLRPGLENFQGELSFVNDRLVVDRFEGSLGQGRTNIDGYVLFKPDDFPVFNVGMNFRDNKIQFYPVNVAEVESGRLTFVGDKPPYLFSGKVQLRSLLMKQNFDVKKQQSIKSAKYMPYKSFGQSGLYTIRIDAEAAKGVLVQNDILDAEFSGKLTLLNNFEFPQVVGRADLVEGRLLFRNTPFELDHAIIRTTNPLDFDPWFSIGGNSLLDSYKITIFASGNSSNPKISLGSSPALPQEEILSLLAFGYIDRAEGQVNPDDLNTITYTEVSSLLLDQLRLNKDLKSRGLSVRVAPEVIQNEANIVRPRAETDSAVPKIIIQTQVIDNIDASLGTTVGSTQSQQFDLNVEYHLNDKVSIQSVYEQEPGTEAGETRTSFGADLKFKWGFK